MRTQINGTGRDSRNHEQRDANRRRRYLGEEPDVLYKMRQEGAQVIEHRRIRYVAREIRDHSFPEEGEEQADDQGMREERAEQAEDGALGEHAA
jgi:hypothetical protein